MNSSSGVLGNVEVFHRLAGTWVEFGEFDWLGLLLLFRLLLLLVTSIYLLSATLSQRLHLLLLASILFLHLLGRSRCGITSLSLSC